jgi:predicted DNA-binding transcriptional regulator AlpA
LRAGASYQPHPLKIYRPHRLAALLDIDATTLWRWRKAGIVPPPVEIGPGIRGWTEAMVGEMLQRRQDP